MTTFSKVLLSASTDGQGVVIVQTGTVGTLIHTASAASLDEIWLWIQNTGVLDVKVTLEYGGATAPDKNIEAVIPGESGLYQLLPGVLLTNSLTLRAFAATASVLVAYGFVNRIT